VSVSQKAFSNGNLLPGYFIEKGGDSVRCQIDYADWGRNPEAVNVIVDNVQKTLKPTDIRGFGVTGYCDYISAGISYHLGPVSGNNIPQQYLNRTETKTAFLKLLVAGPYSLYEFISPERVYYFISENGGQPLELVYQIKQADMLISEDAEYRSELAQYLTKENLWEQESADLGRLGYSKSGFMKMVIRLNEAHTGKKAQPEKRRQYRTAAMQVDVYAGAVIHDFPSTFAAGFTTAKLPSTVSPLAGLTCRIILPGHFGAYSFGFGVGYTTLHSSTTRSGTAKVGQLSNTWYEIADYSERIAFSNSLFLTNAYFIYTFPSKGKWKPYGKIGLNADFVRSSTGSVYTTWTASYTAYHSTNPPYADGTNGRTDETIHTGNTAISAGLAVGAQYGRHRLELEYDTPTELAANGQSSFKVGGIGVHYIFTVIR